MENSFKFLNYDFDESSFIATFDYQDSKKNNYKEQIFFQKTDSNPYDKNLLDKALFLAFILIGTSYYKTFPSKKVILLQKIDEFQANFFNHVYQEGLSQYAFENNLTRSDLAHFEPTTSGQPNPIPCNHSGIINLQSGGKDSLLTSAILQEKKQPFSTLYISSSDNYPKILDQLNAPLLLIKRKIDLETLKKSGGKNGHVPITYIVQSIALIQAILSKKKIVLTSIGQEGNENHAYIDDLPVNHQWSKTWPAEQLFAEYVHKYISKDLEVGSILRPHTELFIAEQFVQKCWDKFGNSFSSCNVANYEQNQNNTSLKWCGKCAKCANSFLLFMPFLPKQELTKIFGKNLLQDKSLEDTFKGLLGIDNVMKPFECIGEIDELRLAYHLRSPEYGNLDFKVPASSFDYLKNKECQKFVEEL